MKQILACSSLLGLLGSAAWASGQMVAISDLERGKQVTIRGVVERITDEDEFRLADESGSVRVYIGPNWVPARVGETVTVAGTVDEDIGPLEIHARSLTRADGRQITFEYHYD